MLKGPSDNVRRKSKGSSQQKCNKSSNTTFYRSGLIVIFNQSKLFHHHDISKSLLGSGQKID